MSQSNDYKRGYSRGYAAGQNRRWPEWHPITPPDPIIGQLVRALQKLRDGVDGELAKFDPDDELEEKLGPLIDDATEALEKLNHWIIQPDALVAQRIEHRNSTSDNGGSTPSERAELERRISNLEQINRQHEEDYRGMMGFGTF